MSGMLLDLVRSRPELAGWLEALERADDPSTVPAPAPLPSCAELSELLLDLAVPHEDVNDIVALCGRVAADADLEYLVGLCARALIRGIGAIDSPLDLPRLPEEGGVAARFFYVLVFLAVLPHTQAFHRERGIPRDISRRTLADLGRNIAAYRGRNGVGGVIAPVWLKRHFRGEIYQLGRLQFQRARLGRRTGAAIAQAGMPLGPGSPSLEVHIPGLFGPITPEACDRSVALAREFFPAHFPQETYRVAVIHSWTLDPQLRDYLPADSNLVRFQDRFRPGYRRIEPDDLDAIRFVFSRPDRPLDEQPRDTTLQRAIADHLRAGGHWYGGNGWFEF